MPLCMLYSHCPCASFAPQVARSIVFAALPTSIRQSQSSCSPLYGPFPQVLHKSGQWEDARNIRIGCTYPLSCNKSLSHFPLLRDSCIAPYDSMVFFDNCSDTNHCKAVQINCEGVLTQATPNGLTIDQFSDTVSNFERQRFFNMSKKTLKDAGSTTLLKYHFSSAQYVA